jgi:hypothetical protein
MNHESEKGEQEDFKHHLFLPSFFASEPLVRRTSGSMRLCGLNFLFLAFPPIKKRPAALAGFAGFMVV